MKLSLLATGLALGLMVCAPAAAAQASCDDIKRLLEMAEVDFDDVAGEELDDDYYRSTLVLPGASGCFIDYSWDSTFVCGWTLPDEASAMRAVAAQTQTLRACLAESSWTAEPKRPEQNGDWKLLGGTRFIGGVDGDLIFDLRADASLGTPAQYEVQLSLSYLL